MITSGTVSRRRIVAGVVLDHAGDADAVFAQDLRQRREHAGRVGDREPEVVAAPDLVGRRARQTGRRVGPEVKHPRGQDRPAGDHVDQVADDGRSRGHHAGTSAVEERVADGVADDPDRVVGPAHLGQRRARFTSVGATRSSRPAAVSLASASSLTA